MKGRHDLQRPIGVEREMDEVFVTASPPLPRGLGSCRVRVPGTLYSPSCNRQPSGYVMMFTTRAASMATMISDVVACNIISTLVRGETNCVAVTLNAALVLNARNR